MIHENIGLSFHQMCSVTLKVRQIAFRSGSPQTQLTELVTLLQTP